MQSPRSRQPSRSFTNNACIQKGKAKLKPKPQSHRKIRRNRTYYILAPGYSCTAAGGGGVLISGPDGYKYKAVPPIEGRTERFVSVGLKVSDLPKSCGYWCDLLGMSKFSKPAPASEATGGVLSETVGYGEEQVKPDACPFLVDPVVAEQVAGI